MLSLILAVAFAYLAREIALPHSEPNRADEQARLRDEGPAEQELNVTNGRDEGPEEVRGNDLLQAARDGDAESIKHILTQAGVTADAARAADAHDGTALHLAAQHGHVLACKVLLDGGASADAVDARGRQPAQLAAEAGHKRVVGLFKLWSQRPMHMRRG